MLNNIQIRNIDVSVYSIDFSAFASGIPIFTEQQKMSSVVELKPMFVLKKLFLKESYLVILSH
jgi:hypothetical protein